MSDALIQLEVADTFTYGPETLCTVKTDNSLFDTFGVGSCHSSQIDITMKNVSDVIPKMAKLELSMIVNNVSYPKGTFFIDTREVDSASDTVYPYDTLTIHGFDAMMKAEQAMFIVESPEDWEANKEYKVDDTVHQGNKYYKCKVDHTSGSTFDISKWEEISVGDQGEWPQLASVVLSTIATEMGVSIDSATSTLISSQNFYVQYPGYGENGYTFREVLGYIGAMYAGNWIISDDNKLKLIQLNETKNSKIITAYESFTAQPNTKQYTRVSVECGNDVSFTAGNDTGIELVVECPWGTQAIADYILAKVTGFTYKPYEAENILYTNDLILGDKITVENTTSYIYSLQVDYGPMCIASISGPGDSETEHEYSYEASSERRITRNENNVKNLKTEFVVRAGEIYSLVSGNLKSYRQATDPSTATGAKINIGDNWLNSSTNVLNRWNGESWDEIGLAAVASYPDWTANTQYKRFDMVTYNNLWYKANQDHTSGSAFDSSKWTNVTSVSLETESQIYQTLDGISLSVNSSEAGSSIVLNAGGIVSKSTGPMYFETNEAHFSGLVSAPKIAVKGSDGHFIVMKSVNDVWTPVGFIGYGVGSTGVSTTDGVMISGATTDSSEYTTWVQGASYGVGYKVIYNSRYYICTTQHFNEDVFTPAYWEELPGAYVPNDQIYFIATQSGVRMQAPGHSIYVGENGCYADGVLIGQAVFGP